MAEQRSVALYDAYQSAMVKVDHFVTGVAAALVGYLGTQGVAGPLGWNPSTLQVGALVAFVGATLCGVRRIQWSAKLLGQMSRHHFEHEEGASMTEVAGRGAPMKDMGTGQVMAPPALHALAARHRAAADTIGKAMDATEAKALCWYKWRDRLLLGGMGLLALSRVLFLFLP